MSPDRIVLVTGATGKQGGALVRALDGAGFRLRAMTRKPDSEAAQALAARGVEVVRGDLDDEASLRRPLEGAWGTFALQNTWEAGVEAEEAQGKRFARAAREAGVQHYVYSSVGSAHKATGIPHFDNKARVEATVRELAFPSHVIIRPVFFMENLVSPWFLHGDRIISALNPSTPLQMIAVEDVGRVAARAFTDAANMKGREVDIAGDTATMTRVAEVFTRASGRPIQYERIPMDKVRESSGDFAAMLEWFERVGYDAEIAGLEREFGLRFIKLDEWASQHGQRSMAAGR